MERREFPLFVALLICSGIVVTESCNLLSVNECTAILSKGTNVNIQNRGISAIPSAETLTQMCNSLDEFRACYDPKAAACVNDTVFSMTFGTIKKTIDFLCEEGFDDIMQHASCWNRTEVVEGQSLCHHNQTRKIASLRQHGHLMGTAERRNHWCIDILENTTQCMVQTVDTICGAGPACSMHTMMNRALEGLATLMLCPKSSKCTADVSTAKPSSPDENATHHLRPGSKTIASTAPQNQQSGAILNLVVCFILTFTVVN